MGIPHFATPLCPENRPVLAGQRVSCSVSILSHLCSLGTSVSISTPLCWTVSSPKLPVCPHINVNIAPCAVLRRSVMFDSLWPHGLWPARHLCPWGFSRQEDWSGLQCPPPGESSRPRDRTQVSRIASGLVTIWATKEAQHSSTVSFYNKTIPLFTLSVMGRGWEGVRFISNHIYQTIMPLLLSFKSAHFIQSFLCCHCCFSDTADN